MSEIVIPIFIFVLGASIGSFLSVVVHRIAKNEKGIFIGTSHCPECHKKLLFRDMIPIISFMIRKGKCRFCKRKISSLYPSLELFTALTFTAHYIYYTGNGILNNAAWQGVAFFIFHLIYATLFIGIFFYDLLHKQIPDLFLFPLIGIGIMGSFISGTPDGINMIIAIIIAMLFFWGQRVISKGKWLGEGDVYLAIGMAVILGWQQLLIAIFISYSLGAAISVFLLTTKKVTPKTQIALAPFLSLGYFLTLFFAADILKWYTL